MQISFPSPIHMRKYNMFQTNPHGSHHFPYGETTSRCQSASQALSSLSVVIGLTLLTITTTGTCTKFEQQQIMESLYT